MSASQEALQKEVASLCVSFAHGVATAHGEDLQQSLLPIFEACAANFKRLKHWTDGVSPSDPAEFSREIVWWGRRGQSMLRRE